MSKSDSYCTYANLTSHTDRSHNSPRRGIVKRALQTLLHTSGLRPNKRWLPMIRMAWPYRLDGRAHGILRRRLDLRHTAKSDKKVTEKL